MQKKSSFFSSVTMVVETAVLAVFAMAFSLCIIIVWYESLRSSRAMEDNLSDLEEIVIQSDLGKERGKLVAHGGGVRSARV